MLSKLFSARFTDGFMQIRQWYKLLKSVLNAIWFRALDYSVHLDICLVILRQLYSST